MSARVECARIDEQLESIDEAFRDASRGLSEALQRSLSGPAIQFTWNPIDPPLAHLVGGRRASPSMIRLDLRRFEQWGAQLFALAKLELRMVQIATPRYLIRPDGSVSDPDYSESAPTCPICLAVRERMRSKPCTLHARARP